MRLFRAALLAIILALPLSASAVTVVELQAQISALLGQITALQQSLTGGATVTPPSASPATGSCPALTRNLGRGMSGPDVSALQEYLKRDPAVYPEGQVTGYYGALTERAVQTWQAINDVISSGSAATTGYGAVGPKTRARIASVCAGTSPNFSKPEFGATMKITPVTGFAPLIVNVLATVNTVGHCEATIYTLDFGDGSSLPIPTAKGSCQPQSVNIPHVFQYAGVYDVKLGVGSHETHVAVSVAGTPSPTQTPANTAPQASVTMDNMKFAPETLTVEKGTIVTWKNTSNVSHTVTADDESFDGGTLQPNQTYSLRLEAPGEYPYYCKLHGVPGGRGGMAGKIIVTDSAAAGSQNQSSGSGGPAFTYNTMTLTPTGLQATASFNIRGACDTYSVDWGDDSNSLYKFGDGSACATPQNIQATHTYSAAGTYTVTLARGATLQNETTGSVTVGQ